MGHAIILSAGRLPLITLGSYGTKRGPRSYSDTNDNPVSDITVEIGFQ